MRKILHISLVTKRKNKQLLHFLLFPFFNLDSIIKFYNFLNIKNKHSSQLSFYCFDQEIRKADFFDI